jgi:abequosyltransferase
MTIPKLSICIATLNRAAFIGETLDSIIAQSTSEVEIVVLDGASKDNTQQVVAERQRLFPRLRYLREDANGGVDQDFDKAVELARGDYCWLMSDDDLLIPGAIAAALAGIDRGYSLVILNAEVRNSDLSRIIEARRLNIDSDRSYGPEDLDGLFVAAGSYLTFIGCVIIKRELWLSRERARYYGSLFIHVGVIFQDSLPSGAFVVARPLISIRYGTAMWRPKQFEIWMFKWPSLVWSLTGLSDAAKSKLCPQTPFKLLKSLVVFRANGVYSMQEYRKWVRPRFQSRWLRIAARLIAVIPGILANVFAQLYMRAFSPNPAVQLADIRSSRYALRNWFKRQSVR